MQECDIEKIKEKEKKDTLFFKPIKDTDKLIIKKFLDAQKYRICDYTYGVLYMWGGLLSYEYAISNNMLIIRSCLNNIMTFSIPLGEGDLAATLDDIELFCNENNYPLYFHGVTEEAVALLQKHFGDIFHVKNLENWGEYLYDYSDLLYLKGKKYHSKRNHINQFANSYHDYVFKEIRKEDIPRIAAFTEKYFEESDKERGLFLKEREMLKEIMKDYEKLDFLGGYIEVEGQIAAFAMGEIQNDIMYVHIEKADREFKGSYAIINNEYLKYFKKDGVLYVNREEDVGDPGLRKAKMSYYPIEIIKKHSVRKRGDENKINKKA